MNLLVFTIFTVLLLYDHHQRFDMTLDKKLKVKSSTMYVDVIENFDILMIIFCVYLKVLTLTEH